MEQYHRLIVLGEKSQELGGHILNESEKVACKKASSDIASGHYSKLFPKEKLCYMLIRMEFHPEVINRLEGVLTNWQSFTVATFTSDGSMIRPKKPSLAKV